MFKDIFIAKGERLTDKDGKTICFAARDILWDEKDFGEDCFADWRVERTDEPPFVYDTGLGAPAFWVDGVSRFFDRSVGEENEARKKQGLPPLVFSPYSSSHPAGITIDLSDRFS